MTENRKITENDLEKLFPKLPEGVNKGTMGRLLVVCGSYDASGLSMCGAAYFAAKAAYRCGAGVVEIFTARENYCALAALVPEAVFSLYGYEENASCVTSRLIESIKKSDAVVLGCGLGKGEMAKAIVQATLSSVRCPLLIDADGLNILSENPELWSMLEKDQRRRTVITPHPGEMSRLTGNSIPEILAAVPEAAVEFARKMGVACLLKDHNTAITDGEIVYINQSGNSGMATAGMGDVLAGIIGALIARVDKNAESDVLLRAAAGAYLHGRAGDLSARKFGQYSLNSSDLLSEIPTVIAEIFVKI